MTLYTDATKIAAYLGATFSAGQITQAGVMATNASDFIEKALSRSWLSYVGTPLAVTDEHQIVKANRIWLDHPPVAAISAVGVRMRYAGATTYALSSAHEYELLEAAIGEVIFSPSYEGQRVEIDYTSTETPPAIITQFATELAAGMLALSLAGSAASQAALSGVKRYTLWGGDLSVEYAVPSASSSQSAGAPGSTRLPALWEQIEAIFSRKLSVV